MRGDITLQRQDIEKREPVNRVNGVKREKDTLVSLIDIKFDTPWFHGTMEVCAHGRRSAVANYCQDEVAHKVLNILDDG